MEEDLSFLSLSNSVNIRGVEVRRLAMGEYIRAIIEISKLPGSLFDGQSVRDVIERLASAKGEEARNYITHLLSTAPFTFIKLVGKLVNTDPDRLLNDPSIGLDGMTDIVFSFIEINGLKKSLCQWIDLFRSMSRPATGFKS